MKKERKKERKKVTIMCRIAWRPKCFISRFALALNMNESRDSKVNSSNWLDWIGMDWIGFDCIKLNWILIFLNHLMKLIYIYTYIDLYRLLRPNSVPLEAVYGILSANRAASRIVECIGNVFGFMVKHFIFRIIIFLKD